MLQHFPKSNFGVSKTLKMTTKKVLVVGEVNTGKTSLVNRAVSNTFNPTYKATIACEFGTKTVDVGNMCVTLQLWDIAGQDRMASGMTRVYCRDAVAALIVCDVSDRATIQRAADWH
jgi:Ras-related protein Rab-32